jgi:hypothetical protein
MLVINLGQVSKTLSVEHQQVSCLFDGLSPAWVRSPRTRSPVTQGAAKIRNDFAPRLC